MLVYTCRLDHLSVCVIGLSLCPESVRWQNGRLDPDAFGMVSRVGRGMGVLDGGW